MNLLKSIFKKEKSINTNNDFWDWFIDNEKKFHRVIRKQGDIQNVFFNKLSPKLDALREGYWFLVGMYDENTAELILTADGNVKNIVFVEELVASAPKIKGWRITALKPEVGIENASIEMDGYVFSNDTLNFYSNDLKEYPDEIDITVTHKDYNGDNKNSIVNGVYLCLDNALGELKSISIIDNLKVINPNEATQDLVPFAKMKDFLTWREKEFIEKYEGFRRETDNDNYSLMEAKLKSGKPLLATLNMDLLEWDCKASHPWVAIIEFEYSNETEDGMPNEEDYTLLNSIEEDIMIGLKDYEGNLNLGRQTADGVREIYFVCIDFRKPSKIFDVIESKYSEQFCIKYEIYKDKYWQTFNRYMN